MGSMWNSVTILPPLVVRVAQSLGSLLEADFTVLTVLMQRRPTLVSHCTPAILCIHVRAQTPSPDHSPEGCVSHTQLGNVTIHGLDVEQGRVTPFSGIRGCTKFEQEFQNTALESFGGSLYGINQRYQESWS